MAIILCWHKWAKWSEIIDCYTAPYQFSSCEKCNKIIQRRVTFTGNEVNTATWNHSPDAEQLQSVKTRLDHTLAVLGEECGEAQQVLGKINRFGILDKNPRSKKTNWVELRKEVHDIMAVYEMVCDEFDRVSTLDRSLIAKKKKRVEKYMQYAIDVGQLVSQ